VTQPNLILLPGLDGTGILFRPLLAALPPDIRPMVVAYPTDHRLSLVEHAEIVARQLPRDEVVVLAESFSGLVALRLLSTHGHRIKALLVIASFAEPPRPLLLRLAPLVPWRAFLMRWAPDFALRQFCLGREANRQQLALLRETLAAVSPEVLAHRLGIAGTRQPFIELQFKVPCYYLQASHDRLVPPGAARWFQDHIQPCQVESLAGPHFLLQARPQECAEWIAAKMGTT
jgi:pimeloyl-[acyl-carrier protein] methyl ester esterase